MICPQCNNDVLFFPPNEQVCTECAKVKDERLKVEQADKKRAKNRAYKQKERGSIMGKFVIYHKGKWKRSNMTPPWEKFSIAHVYVSKGRADHACRMIGHGVVMERFDTEKETLAMFRKELKRVI